MKRITTFAFIVLAILATGRVFGQNGNLSFFRANDQGGINVFETPKGDSSKFNELKVKIGGNFTQQIQMLSHSSKADPNNVVVGATTYNLNELYHLSSGFNLATANLKIDAQLADGIRLSLDSYMSSRHHQEFWVKGGYVQIDKLPMLGSPKWFENYVTVKVGHMEVNYGDQHFRRSDNGNTFYNPFVGNYIMDAFSTEIGGEVYVYPFKGVFIMGGLTNGLIKGDVEDSGVKKNPSILTKVGYDSQLSDNLRVRLSASLYNNQGTTSNTLYAGDRTGSRYYMVVEPYWASPGVKSATNTKFTSGRLNPGFSHKVTSFSISPFVKYMGLEFFGTYEMAKGTESKVAPERTFNQLAGELVYRFMKNEQFFMGVRYNTVKGELAGYANDVTINRIQTSMGWYPTPNLLVKLEYVNQNYKDFASTDIRYKAGFDGVMVEAAIAF